MKKIKIGLLPLYIQLYDDINFDRTELNEFCKTIANKFIERDFDVKIGDVCKVKNEFDKTVSEFENSNVDVIVTLHLAYSPSLECVDALSKTKLPIVVLDTTEALSFSSKYSHKPIMFNHGIHGVMDMCNLLKRRGKKYAICAGHIKKSNVIERVCNFVKASYCASMLQNSKTTLYGTSFEGMGDFIISKEDLKEKFGITLLNISNEKMKQCFDSITDKEIEEEKENYKNLFEYNVKDDSDILKDTIKACLTVRKINKENNADAFSVNFRDICKSNLTTMPFIETCLELYNGIGYAGEGDVLTASILGSLKKCFNESSFIEIFCPDWKKNRLFISHMGEMDIGLCQKKPNLFESRFRYNDSKDCAKISGVYKGGKAVFCNVYRAENEEFRMIVSPIKMLNMDRNEFSTSIRGWFKSHLPIAEFLEKLSIEGAIHHSILLYNTDIEVVKHFGNLIGLKVVEI